LGRQRSRVQPRRRDNNNTTSENIIDIKDYKKPLQKNVVLLPKNRAQEKYIDSLRNPDISVVVACGDAGTGKTYIATAWAIQCLKAKTHEKIIVTRPLVAVDDRDIGYLPGDIMSKMSPWTRPVLDVFAEYFNAKQVAAMLEEGIIELVPLAYIRGRTFKNAVVIVDEAQNTTANSMLSALTRIGEGSKMVVTGDVKQSDRGSQNGLQDFLNRNPNIPGVAVCPFGKQHVERHPVISAILNLYGED